MRGQHWRKSSQWFGLNREHVELVMGDAMVNKAFHDHCYPTTEDGWSAPSTLTHLHKLFPRLLNKSSTLIIIPSCTAHGRMAAEK